MRIDCALLCDAVTVREGLLHILGGGVTRLYRPSYPSALGCSLALRIQVHPTESDRKHELEAILMPEDGKPLGRLTFDFEIDKEATIGMQPGEEFFISVPVDLRPVEIPSAGPYSFEILVDGIHQMAVPFAAVLPIKEGSARESTD